MQKIWIFSLFLWSFEAMLGQKVLCIVENNKIVGSTKIKNDTTTKNQLYKYVEKYRQKGFVVASIDSTFEQNDSFFAVFCRGTKYYFDTIQNIENKQIIVKFKNKPANLTKLSDYFEKQIADLNNRGYPYSQLSIWDISFESNKVNVNYKVDLNNFIVYDSVYFSPKVRISEKFLANYLNCQKKKAYNHQNIKTIDKKIDYINCLQLQNPTQIEFHTNSADVYLYIINKKVSSFSGVLALELKDKKIQLLGQADIRLINTFRRSDEISLQWNKISPQSQFVNLNIDIPYIFGTKMGFSDNFSFKQADTTLFVVNNAFYLNYFIVAYSRISFLYEFRQTVSFDTIVWGNSLKQNFFGISLFNTTLNDLYCPTNGWDYKVNLSLNPDNQPQTAFMFYGYVNFYRQFIHKLILKLSTTNLYYQSNETQKNELYNIGGANLLRGFEQDAFLCSAYNVNTLEMRWLYAKYSFIALFFDFAFFKEYEKVTKYAHSLGLSFQINTKQTIFGLSIALGSIEKQKFDIRQTKIHLKISNFL